jgi:EAL and modified HD-GYP domain-containing signal transduction protein
MENLFIARQPIYDRKLAVMGYELLYRSSEVNQAIFEDGNLASCETIINTFMHIGLENLIGSAPAFINLPTDFVLNHALTPMFREQCVLEILEDVAPVPRVIESLRELKNQGYRIALDDFEYSPAHTPLLQLADFVKIDVLNAEESGIRARLEHVRPFKAKIIAEKVETQELHQLCMNLGFDYFQGYFCCRPQLVKHKMVPANRMVILQLLSRLHNPNVDYAELESILSQDITLTYKLLRYINSATFGMRREISSIKDAVMLLGLINIRDWLSMILMSRVIDNKPGELIVTAMIRGKMCELLAQAQQPAVAPQMFITGLFSVLDALMDTPMVELMDTINLSTPIKLALLDNAGVHGAILHQVICHELGDWDALRSTGMSASEYTKTYLEAVRWADQTMAALMTS